MVDLLTALAGLYAGFIGWRLLLYSRSVYGIRQLDKGNVDVFMREIDRDIAQSRGAFKTCLQINKSAGYAVQGRFESGEALLRSLDPSKAPVLFKVLYYNNLIYTLSEMNRLEEAERVVQEAGNLLHQTRNATLALAVRGTLAILAYRTGDRARAEAELSDLVQRHERRTALCTCEYYLGLIELENGKRDEARALFEKAVNHAGWSHNGKAASKFLATL